MHYWLFLILCFSTLRAELTWQDLAKHPKLHQATKEELQSLRELHRSDKVLPYLEEEFLHALVHDGDLKLEGNYHSSSLVIIKGNLSISGNYHDYMGGIGILVVQGTLEVDNLYSWGAIHVSKDLQAKGIILTVYNDFTFQVRGKVHARAIFTSDKDVDYTADETTTEMGDAADRAKSTEALLLIRPEFFTNSSALEREEDDDLQASDLSFDDGLGENAIRYGKPIFRETKAPASLLGQVNLALLHESKSKELLPLITTDPLLAQIIASRPKLDPTLIDPLLQLPDPCVRERLSLQVPQRVLKTLKDEEITADLAKTLIYNHWSTELAERLMYSQQADVRALLAAAPALSTSMIQQLAKDQEPSVRHAVIENHPHRMAAEAISLLFDDTDPRVRQALVSTALNKQQIGKLLPQLDEDHLFHLAERLYEHHSTHRSMPLNAEELTELATTLLSDPKLKDATAAFMCLPLELQQKCWKEATSNKRIDPERLAEDTPYPDMMEQVILLAHTHQQPIPRRLAKNPRLPLSLQKLIFTEATNAKPKAYGDYNPHAMDALCELLGQRHVHSEIMDLMIPHVFKNGYNPTAEEQNAFFNYHHFTPAQISQLHDKLKGGEDWSLTLILQVNASPEHLRDGIPLWYDDEDIQQEFQGISSLDGNTFFTALTHAKAKELREIAAINLSTPLECIRELTKDQDAAVKYSAQHHPSLPVVERLEWAKQTPADDIDSYAFTADGLRELITSLPEGTHKIRAENMLAKMPKNFKVRGRPYSP